MHPLGWLLKYFLLALAAAVTTDKAIDMTIADKIGEPWKGMFFRGNRDDSGGDRRDS
jgi:hypothetical protein